ncbi:MULTISPECIES: hypothetical protein [unclassified Moorena]|uniref:hypothetical protein n=1 Tax=unclassified Moorena TaxID=2683338 RepID=UPI0025D8063F|nr:MULTISPECIES: hypothetical protein [unclassified Moorena]
MVKNINSGGIPIIKVWEGWGDGEMGRWGDGEMGRWGDGEMGRFLQSDCIKTG